MNWLRGIKDVAIIVATISLPLLLQALSDWAMGDEESPGPTEGG